MHVAKLPADAAVEKASAITQNNLIIAIHPYPLLKGMLTYTNCRQRQSRPTR